jgi:tetrahydromethanopterin S-methyltransferase subunit C
MVNTARIKNLLVAPRIEWPQIADQKTDTAALYTTHVVPLAAIGPICSFIGLSIVGVGVPMMGHYRVPLLSGLAHAVVGFVLTLIGVFVLGRIINMLAPRFSAQPDEAQALKLAAYAATPTWLGGVLQLLPALAILGLLAVLYSLYLLYIGLPLLMKAPAEKAGTYTLAIIGVAIVIGIVMGALAAVIMPSPGFTSYRY